MAKQIKLVPPRVHTGIIDWDGTAVPNVWPENADEFMPGFVENMRRLHAAGVKLVIASASLTPYDPYTGTERDPSYMMARAAYMRDLLDRHGLTFISIWTKWGKPGGSFYVDDKAERYGGRPNSWARVTDKILIRLGKEVPEFPAFPDEAL